MTMEPILIMQPNYTAQAARNTRWPVADIAGFQRVGQ
jgi:hypothetical protein